MASLKDIVDGLKPAEKSVSFNGQTLNFLVRHITSGERLEILAGQKFSGSNGTVTMEVDLQTNEVAKQKWVQFCVLNDDGSQMFAHHNAVKRLPGPLVDLLHKAVSEHNKDIDGDELGKS